VPWTETGVLLRAALEAMTVRGRANLGDKTVLDALDAAAGAAAGRSDPQDILAAAASAVDAAMARMRPLPAKVGRARIFAERSVGLDDPGMLAFREMLRGLGG
jgi:dihydroxyacetone kinase-like protein